MRLTNLTTLILQLNKLIDTGKYDWITPKDVRHQIEIGEIFEYIADRGKADIDLSFLNEKIKAEILVELKEILAANSGQEAGKWGAFHNGVCLLLAWVNELIQMRLRAY